jgi:hypothetical protein
MLKKQHPSKPWRGPMKRVEKAILPLVRKLAHNLKNDTIYYWSDSRLRDISAVMVMPRFYYQWLHKLCLMMAEFNALQGVADTVIHTIPLQVRFEVA